MRDVESIVGDSTLSMAERIRILHIMGMSRAEIARSIDRRYQQVANTLTGPGAETAIQATRARLAAEGNSEGRVPDGDRVDCKGLDGDVGRDILRELQIIRELLEVGLSQRNADING